MSLSVPLCLYLSLSVSLNISLSLFVSPWRLVVVPSITRSQREYETSGVKSQQVVKYIYHETSGVFYKSLKAGGMYFTLKKNFNLNPEGTILNMFYFSPTLVSSSNSTLIGPFINLSNIQPIKEDTHA